tara:strand:- start:2482 stop:4347 length:1866 start_codon:yes stop_codon:yes gene_type:complete
MAIKYNLQYYDVANILHSLEISSTSYVGSSTEVTGTVYLDYATTTDAEEAIRGKGLRVELDASLALTFDDLYTEDEMYWSVAYVRDSETMFNGWLNSDGLFEDFVSDKWLISLNCVDGLGFLKDLSYVNSSGITYTGQQKELDIIANCLKRTGVTQNIHTNIDVYYTGLSTSVDVLANVYLNSNRFVKDDGETIMNCDEVLRSVLEPYGACITSFKGEWYIYKPNQLFSDDTPTFFGYDEDGVALSPTTKTLAVGYDLGSQIDGYYPHHCNSNQRLSNDRAISAYRINYKYGVVSGLLGNTLLAHNAVTIDDWTINSSTNLTLNASGLGVDLDWNATVPVKNLTSDVITLVSGDLISYRIKVETTALAKGSNVFAFNWGVFNYKIRLGTNYYYDWITNAWILADTTNISLGSGLNTVQSITFDMPALPVSGDITVEIWTPEDASPGATIPDTGTFYLQEVSVYPTNDTTDDKKGEFHTLERNTAPTSKVKNIVTIYNGDVPSDLYDGTIYKTDQTTPTETWARKGISEAFALLRIMGEETLRLNQSPMRVFSGDIYGYIPYLSIVSVNNVTGLFMFVQYSYNTKANTISAVLKQIYGAELVDIDYLLTYDYGNVVKPTIRG